MATSIALRSSFLRTVCRLSSNSATRSVSLSSVRSTFVPTRTVISSHSLRLLRRELSSLRPVHSAIASACLVSKLPADACASVEGRFANYLSPI